MAEAALAMVCSRLVSQSGRVGGADFVEHRRVVVFPLRMHGELLQYVSGAIALIQEREARAIARSDQAQRPCLREDAQTLEAHLGGGPPECFLTRARSKC